MPELFSRFFFSYLLVASSVLAMIYILMLQFGELFEPIYPIFE